MVKVHRCMTSVVATQDALTTKFFNELLLRLSSSTNCALVAALATPPSVLLAHPDSFTMMFAITNYLGHGYILLYPSSSPTR